MKFYGDINLLQNQLKQAVLESYAAFPAQPKVGQIAYVSSIVYICIDVTSDPVWVPLTREINCFAATFSGTTWNVQHDLGSIDVSVQIYDEAGSVIFPDAIVLVDANNLQITFSSAQTGRCVVISGSVSGIARPQYGFVFTQATASNTWTIDHNLGYYPAVKIFVDGYEVQPSQIYNPSLNRTIVSFTSPKDGVARLI